MPSAAAIVALTKHKHEIERNRLEAELASEERSFRCDMKDRRQA
jgi:hypothetical protein